MAKYIKEGTKLIRPDVYFDYQTDDVVDTATYQDGHVAAFIQADFGDTEHVTKITNKSQIKENFGDGGTTDLINYIFEGGASEVDVVRLGGKGAYNAYTYIPVKEIERVANITQGQTTTGETVESCTVAYTTEANKITAKFSNVPEGYTIKGLLRLGSGICGLIPGRIEMTTTKDTIVVTLGPDAPVNGEYSLECSLTKEKETKKLGSVKFTAEVETTENYVEKGDITVQVKYPGKRMFSYQIKEDITTPNTKILSVLENGSVLETLPFKTGEDQDEGANLVEQLKKSKYLEIKEDEVKHKVGDIIDPIATEKITGGKNPTITNQSYVDAFSIASRTRFNAFVIDTVDPAIQNLAAEFNTQLFENGYFCFFVAGTPSDDNMQQKIEKAQAFDDKNIILVGSGYRDVDGNEIDEALFAGQVAGMVASIPSSKSITNKEVKNAVELLKSYTNEEYEQADVGGLVTITIDDEDRIVIELGVTTLNTLVEGIDDEGWKKIKRGRIRQELFQRCNISLNKAKGDLTPDDDGYSYAKSRLILVLEEMVVEKKIRSGYEIERRIVPDEPQDEVSFDIKVRDYDSLEKFKLHYNFSKYAE